MKKSIEEGLVIFRKEYFEILAAYRFKITFTDRLRFCEQARVNPADIRSDFRQPSFRLVNVIKQLHFRGTPFAVSCRQERLLSILS